MPSENEENVIIIEDEKEQKSKKNKKIIFILIALLILLIILLLVLLLIIVKKKEEQKSPIQQEINKITKKLNKKNTQTDALKALIKKANYYYQKGEKEKALKILNKISQYSQAISYYNLGVIKIEEKNYKKALEYFQKAIENEDNRAISAINATFCALKLKNKKLFKYYSKLSYTLLDEIKNLKSYPYYYALVMYYNGYEFNSLKALENYQTPYKNEANKLLSSIYEYYNLFNKAQDIEIDPFYKGISLAEIGEYSLAKNFLSLSNKKEAKFALALVDLKTLNYKEAGKLLKNFEFNNIYPIEMFLKDSLFDIKTAQKEFKENFLTKNSDFFDLFFYYAPYKVFNINKTIDYLKKGVVSIPANSLEESKNYLFKTASYAKLNLEISKVLKLALTNHIYLANKEFKKLLLKKPHSYILHYNLALSYAQLKDYKNAAYHFIRAYHLNPNDLKSGIFALMALKKLKKDDKYLTASIKDSLDENSKLANILMAIIENNFVQLASFLNKNTKNTPLFLISKIAAKKILNKDFTKEASYLKKLYPNDLISNLLLFYAKNENLPINQLALKFQPLFLNNRWNLDKFFYGPEIAKEWLFQFSKISGMLYKLREILIQKSKTETYDLIPILKSLAFINLYTKHFEESYVIYNDLINNKNINDANTLYNAAVSAIGANHHSNAVALMELAKLKNPTYYEARYGLGLLWQEANNIRAASIQYIKIPDGFKSKFFDFNIKNPN